LHLRILDLSLNEIDDISPLFGLEHLEYVNLFGNPVPPGQIVQLKDSGCTVLS
jgi:Leucine-rich repeat (LRR) protein